MKNKVWHPKIIEAYLEKYYSTNSRDTARNYLKNFFTTMNEDPDKLIKKSNEEITKIIWDYVKRIENRAPKTQNAMLSFIKKFLVRHRKAIDDVEWEDIRNRNKLKRVRPITKKKTPSLQDLKKILSYTTSIKAKSLFVFCASSGCRIDEALKLTWNDIDLDERMVILIDETAKFDNPRYTFFTPECKELLELWKPERIRMMQLRYKKSKYLRDKLEKQGYEVFKVGDYWIIKKDGKELTKEEIISLDNRIWPFDYVNAVRMWVALLEKACDPFNEIDNNEKLKFKKYLYNEHCLRRFWFTQLASDRANEDYVNYIGGHISELNASYKQFDSEIMRRKVKEEYDSHIRCLSIFEAQPDLSDIHQQMQEKDQKISELEKKIEEMNSTLTKMIVEKTMELSKAINKK